jgi:hypothetical protein
MRASWPSSFAIGFVGLGTLLWEMTVLGWNQSAACNIRPEGRSSGTGEVSDGGAHRRFVMYNRCLVDQRRLGVVPQMMFGPWIRGRFTRTPMIHR